MFVVFSSEKGGQTLSGMNLTNCHSVKLYSEFVRKSGTYGFVNRSLPHISGYILKRFIAHLKGDKELPAPAVYGVLLDLELCYETVLGFNPLLDIANKPLKDLDLNELDVVEKTDDFTFRTN